ncbi:MAG: hypothetical protein HOE48_05695 [Candidatus Latescibacteria bacterium]|nr:hypothetical protein [Candidatus Latescibacterota bacterium]
MLDLSRFSDVLSQFGAGFPAQNLSGKPKAPSLTAPKAPEPSNLADILSLSSVGSNNPGASFDRQEPSVVAVKSDGTYRPTQVQQQFSSSSNFSFSASLSRATVIQRANAQGGSITRASESSQFSYRSQALSTQRRVGNSFSEARRFQTDMSFSRTRTLSQRMSPEVGQKLESTGRQVTRQFEIEISLDASFLKQFNVQTEGLAEDEDMLGQYLDNTGGLAGQSGEALKAFFDEVDQILADTESFVTDTMGSFLADVKAAFGLNDSDASAFNDMVVEEVAAFFEDVDDFLNDARQSMRAGPDVSSALPVGSGIEEAAALV